MTDTTDTTDDPERLARITAHAIARFADRFDFVRKFSRHMEGTDKKAGILSDIFAALVELYKRNPRVFEHAAKSYALEIHKQHQTRKAQQTSTPTNHTDPNGGSNHATP